MSVSAAVSSRRRRRHIAFGLWAGMVFALAQACGGKARPPVKPPATTTTPTPASAPPPAVSPERFAAVPRTADLALAPSIRIGLVTAADVVRLSSGTPFDVAVSPTQSVTTQDLLVEQGRGPSTRDVEGQVYRVRVASFLDRGSAERLVSMVEKDTGEKAQVAREPVTGRFAVRVGKWTTDDGAMATRESLKRMGYESLQVVAEPATSAAGPIILRPAGAPPIVTERRAVAVLPRQVGAFIEVDGTPYRGFIELVPAPSGGITVVNVLNLEDYLKGVVPGELSPEVYPQVEAQKAQSIAARTYALRHLGQYAAEGYDLCPTPACQVYRGVSVEHRLSTQAVVETAGEVLTYGGELADTLYTSTCGGRTEDSSNVFSGEQQPYLVSRSCYSESPPLRLAATGRAVGPDVAAALVGGVVTEEELFAEPLDAPVAGGTTARWIGRALGALGQAPCPAPPGPGGAVTLARFATMLMDTACVETRVPFFLSPEDVERWVSRVEAPSLTDAERRALAFWIQDQVIRPNDRGLGGDRTPTRAEVLGILSRFVARRAEPALVAGQVVALDPSGLKLKVGAAEEVVPLASRLYLFRRYDGSAHFAPVLALLPGDRVHFHRGEAGIDFLELEAAGASFDRSSRFSYWVVRKTAAELTAQVGGRDGVGEVVDLKPLRYGRSGRVAELLVAGSEKSVTLKGLTIRTRLGIRENLFFIDKQLTSGGAVAAWVFSGRGWGHGVGLCQVGAYGMAASGYTYREILGHFYLGASVSRFTPSPISSIRRPVRPSAART